MIDATHDAGRRSWVESANGHSEFPLQNLPFGVFERGGVRRGCVAIGDQIVDVSAVVSGDPAAEALREPTLNRFMGLPSHMRRALRAKLVDLLDAANRARALQSGLIAMADARLVMPAEVGDYTDFYAGIHHAMNVGALFRPDQPLLPNYKHVPIGYHGRSSSLVTSGASVVRPNGQRKPPDAELPTFGPTQRLDYEVELAVWIGAGNPLGRSIAIADAEDAIVGLGLLNDWSARDVQAWEYQPLGPFLAKSFVTQVSPWIVSREALEPFRVAQPERPAGDPQPLPHLVHGSAKAAFGIEVDVAIQTERMRSAGTPPHRVARVHATDLYWTIAQLVTHHTSNGCNLRPGDLFGTGTISTSGADVGSLLEATRGGKQPITLPTGETRTFLLDGDEVVMTAHAKADGFVPIGFGECRGRVVPAVSA